MLFVMNMNTAEMDINNAINSNKTTCHINEYNTDSDVHVSWRP